MKVSELPYARYTVEQARQEADAVMNLIANAASADDLLRARTMFLSLRESVETATSLANVRFTQNTKDPFYIAEMAYYDDAMPLFSQLQNRYEKAMLDSEYADEASKRINPRIFQGYAVSQRTFSDTVIEDLQRENALVTEYSRFMGDLLFSFEEEMIPLSVLRGKLSDTDRSVRRRAAEAIGETMQAHAETFERLFDELVTVRTTIARKLGYENFIELGYDRLGRIDYDSAMVSMFRSRVEAELVPAVSALKEEIRNRLGWDKTMFYDDAITVAGEVPKPVIGAAEIFIRAQEMYDKMKPEIGDFMRRMLASEAFDVEARPNKWGGGYCTTFPKYRQPFILANFNGSADDIDTITHEFGHALHADIAFRENLPTDLPIGMESFECHSMSMEFFCHPYMSQFFGSLAGAYCYKHTADALSFIPYGVIVDEFQHIVYSQPELTPEERNAVYASLEKKYRPYLSYEGIPYLEQGTRWQYQMHIYESPFYYIDYCLAQCIALGFYALSLRDYSCALKRYLRFLSETGTVSFETLAERAGIGSPFRAGMLQQSVQECLRILKSTSD